MRRKDKVFELRCSRANLSGEKKDCGKIYSYLSENGCEVHLGENGLSQANLT